MTSAVRAYLPIFGRLWRLALPVILSNLLISLVNVVDVFMAGRLGPVEIAAVGMANSVRFLVIVAIFSATVGAMTLAAQAVGSRDLARLSFTARQALSLTVLMATLLSAVGWLIAEPALSFLNSGGDVRAVELGAAYLRILFLGTVFLTFSMAVSSLMQGAGDTLTPLYINAVTNVLNVVFNYVLMFGLGPVPAYGVAGAAMGTVLARLVASGIGLYILYSGRNVVKILPGSYWPDPQMFKDILAIGLPAGLQGMVFSSAHILVLRIVTSTPAGTYGAAALAIGIQVESLSFMPGLAISVAATSLVGQALGAWQVDDARKRGNAAILMAVMVMSVVALVIVAFATPIIRLFDPSAHPTVLAAGTSFLVINALFHPALAVAMVGNGALQGAGDTRPGLFSTVLGRWLVGVPLAYLLALRVGLGVEGVWWALVTGTCLQAALIAWRWRQGAWQGVALTKTALYREHLRVLPKTEQARYLRCVRTRFMALEGTTEHVSEAGVEYRCPDERVRVRFVDGTFEVERPRERPNA